MQRGNKRTAYVGAIVVAFLLFATLAPALQPTPPSNATAERIAQATTTLQALERSAVIPVAVLNNSRCLLIVKQLRPAPAQNSAVGACHIGSEWAQPAFYRIAVKEVSDPPQSRGDAVILVLGADAATRMAAGSAEFAPARAGPLATETPLLPPTELRDRPVLAYWMDGQNVSGLALGAAAVQRDEAESAALKAGRSEPLTISSGKEPGTPTAIAWFERELTAFFDTVRPNGIVIHHSAILPPQSTDADEYLDAFHSDRGFSIVCGGRTYHVAYHYIVLPDGNVEVGRPELCEGAHAKGYNSFIGIVLVGDFSSKDNKDGSKGPTYPTPRQLGALLRLCEQIRARYHIPVNRILRHSDIGTTQCPGDRLNFNAFLSHLLQSNPTRQQ